MRHDGVMQCILICIKFGISIGALMAYEKGSRDIVSTFLSMEKLKSVAGKSLASVLQTRKTRARKCTVSVLL